LQDFQKFEIVFTKNRSFCEPINAEVKEWVENNIERWIAQHPVWFNVSMVDDEFLPSDVFEAAGGARRRRSSISLRELVAGLEEEDSEEREDPLPLLTLSPNSRTFRNTSVRQIEGMWKELAIEIYELRSDLDEVKFVLWENGELTDPLIERCPVFETILAHILLNKLAFRARDIDFTSEMVGWGDEESKRMGRSFANFLRQRKTEETAVDAWRRHYPQLEVLFEEVVGFEVFMVTLANSLLKDSIYGT